VLIQPSVTVEVRTERGDEVGIVMYSEEECRLLKAAVEGALHWMEGPHDGLSDDVEYDYPEEDP